MLFGTRRRKNLVDDDVDKNTVSNLRKQISEQESAYKLSLSASNTSNDQLKSSEKSLMIKATAQENRLLFLKEDIAKADIAAGDALRKWTEMTQKYDNLKASEAQSLQILKSSLDGSNTELEANRQDTLVLKRNLTDVTTKLKKMEIEISCITDLLSKTESSNTSTGGKIPQNVEKLKILLKSEIDLRESTKILQAAKAQLTLEKKKLQSDLCAATKRDEISFPIDEINPIYNSPTQSAVKNTNKKSTSSSNSKSKSIVSTKNDVGLPNIKSGTIKIDNIFEETSEENTNLRIFRKEESQQQQQLQQANKISDVSFIPEKLSSGSGSGSQILYDQLREDEKMKFEGEIALLESSYKNIEVFYDELKVQLEAFIESNSVKIIELNEKESSLLLAEKKIIEMKSEELSIKTKLISIEKEKEKSLGELKNLKTSVVSLENKLSEVKKNEKKLNEKQLALNKSLLETEEKLLLSTKKELVLQEEAKKFILQDLKMKSELSILQEKDENQQKNVTSINISLSKAHNDVTIAKEEEKKLRDALENMEKKTKFEIENIEKKFHESQKKEKSLNLILENINFTNDTNTSELTNSLLIVQNEVKNSAGKELGLKKELEASKSTNIIFLSKIETLEKCINDTKKENLLRLEKENALKNEIVIANKEKSVKFLEISSLQTSIVDLQENLQKIKENERTLNLELNLLNKSKLQDLEDLKAAQEKSAKFEKIILETAEKEKLLRKEKNDLKNLVQISNKDITTLKEEIGNSNNKLLAINEMNIKIEKEKVLALYKLELLEGQSKEVEKLKVKLEDENKFLRNHVEGKNLEVTKLEEICASNLLTSQQRIDRKSVV